MDGNWQERLGRLLLALMVALSAQLAPLSAPARGEPADGGSEVPWISAEADPGGEIERWWGVAGAALCAAEIRLIRVAPAIGMNPYVLAAGIAGCILALVDVMSTK